MSQKIKSAILGLVTADALGVSVEFEDRQTLRINPVTNMRAYGTYNQAAGTWSDDSSLTLALIDSLKEGLNHDDIMQSS